MSASPENDAMRSSETKPSLTCAFSPDFVVRFDASSATSTSVERNADVSSASAILPRVIASLSRDAIQGFSAGLAGVDEDATARAGSKSGWASSSVPSASRFNSTLGASMDSETIRASRPNTRTRSRAIATRSAAISDEPSRRLTSSPSNWASPRSSSRRSEGGPSTNTILRRVVSAPPVRSTRGFAGRYVTYDGNGSASRSMSSVASRRSANGVVAPATANRDPLIVPPRCGVTRTSVS